MTPTLIITLIIVLSILICHMVAKSRGGNPVFWGTMGALFGPLAIPFVFMIKPGRKNKNGDESSP